MEVLLNSRKKNLVIGVSTAVLLSFATNGIAGMTSNQRVGEELATGDFNGDGYDDLVVDIPGENRVGILYSNSLGPRTASSIRFTGIYRNNTPAHKHLDQFGIDETLAAYAAQYNNVTYTLSEYAYPGVYDDISGSFASGDLNNDGIDDLVIGIPSASVSNSNGTYTQAGEVRIYYGATNGLSTTNNVSVRRPGSPWFDERFGADVEVADIDNDNKGDLIVSAPGDFNRRGRVYVYLGDDGAIDENFPWSKIDDLKIVDSATNIGASFGEAITVGDFNGDNRDDLAVGVPRQNRSKTACGKVVIYYGAWHGIDNGTTTIEQGTNNSAKCETEDHFGISLATGKFNNDAYDDLVVGVPAEGTSGKADGGIVQMFYGSNIGLDQGPKSSHWINQKSGSVPGSVETSDYFGSGVVTGDFNNDGYADVALSTIGENIGSTSEVGLVTILYGTVNGLSSTSHPIDFYPGKNGVIGSKQAELWYGAGLTSGDFNNDGIDDLAVGAPGANVNGYTKQGFIHYIFGSNQPSGVGLKLNQTKRIDKTLGGGWTY